MPGEWSVGGGGLGGVGSGLRRPQRAWCLRQRRCATAVDTNPGCYHINNSEVYGQWY